MLRNVLIALLSLTIFITACAKKTTNSIQEVPLVGEADYRDDPIALFDLWQSCEDELEKAVEECKCLK
jgi:hypothetical protein